MTTAGDEMVPCEGDRAGEKFRKQKSSGVSELSTHQAGNYATIEMSEVEQILKHKTFTRSEIQQLITVLNSRITEESSSVMRLEAPSTRSGSLKKSKHGDESHNFHAADISSQQHLTTMENLPDELLSNIFIRLLSKQLAQMRSVSKSWNALLSRSSFIKSHLHRSIHNKSQILLVFYNDREAPPDFKPVTAHLCHSPHLQLPDFIKLPVSPRQSGYGNGFRVIGCINGLICSSYGDSVVQIWNPSLSPYSMPCGDDSTKNCFRFGFDPKRDDYKVVKLTGLTASPGYGIKGWLQIEIYSMRKGTWEFITERFPSHIRSINHNDYVCVDGHDGHLHWVCSIGEKITIVAFDLGSETFREISLPHSIHGSLHLGVLAKKFCVFSQVENNVHAHAFEVWVMEEYGVAESWVKRHMFSQFVGDIYPFGFTSHNEFLIVGNDRLLLYDPIAKKETIFDSYEPTAYFPHNIVEYVDSLVWVAPARREILDGAGQKLS